MKKTKKNTAAVIFVSVLTFCLLFSAPVYADSPEAVGIILAEPISVTADSADAAAEALSAAVNMAVQPAIDALLTDRPETAIWFDVTGTRFQFRYSSSVSDGMYTDTVVSLSLIPASLGEVYDPAGMVSAVRSAVSSFEPSGTTRYETVKSIHDFVCSGAVYDLNGVFAHHAFGALIDGRAVCQGYSEAFKLLCDANGIPCVLVTGVTDKGEQHMWCSVMMDDGKWYLTDVTWDDQKNGSVTYDYFLVGYNKKTGNKTFASTHIGDGDLSNTGLKDFVYPQCESGSYSDSGRAFSPDAKADGWFYSQLDANQKRIYDRLSSLVPPSGSPEYVYTQRESEPATDTDPATVTETVPQSAQTQKPQTETEPQSAPQSSSETRTAAPTDGTTDKITGPDTAGTESGVPAPDTDRTDAQETQPADSATGGDSETRYPGPETGGSEAPSAVYGEHGTSDGETEFADGAPGDPSGAVTSGGDDAGKEIKDVIRRILHVGVIVVSLVVVFSLVALTAVLVSRSDGRNRR